MQHSRAGQSLFPVHSLCIPNLEFLNLGTTAICGWIILCWGSGGCPVHCGIFSSIPDLYSLDASSTLPFAATKNVYRHCQISPSGQNHLQLRITDLTYNFPLIPLIGTCQFHASCRVRLNTYRNWLVLQVASGGKAVSNTFPTTFQDQWAIAV